MNTSEWFKNRHCSEEERHGLDFQGFLSANPKNPLCVLGVLSVAGGSSFLIITPGHTKRGTHERKG
jgi:hypothetical protein